MKEHVRRLPIFGSLARHIYWRMRAFPGSEKYWEERYAAGDNSGVGSYGKFAEFKAAVINRFVADHGLESVIEFGCGDGNQLRLADYSRYLGLDVSETALALCKELFVSDNSKVFKLMREYSGEKADLALSLDVVYHLVEDDVFETYMRTLFEASNRYVIIYSSDSDDNRGYEGKHIRHRRVTQWIQRNLPTWQLIEQIPNKYPYKGNSRMGSFADFFIYLKAYS
jgi:SAM-dependent methyltransferase